MIPFSLDSVLNNRGIAKMELMRGDSIHIYDKNSALGLKIKSVSITGYVKRPSKYPHFDGMTIYDLLFAAGGFEDEIFLKDMFKERADLIRYDKLSEANEIISFNLSDVEANKN